jgi:hypothetical protein
MVAEVFSSANLVRRAEPALLQAAEDIRQLTDGSVTEIPMANGTL